MPHATPRRTPASSTPTPGVDTVRLAQFVHTLRPSCDHRILFSPRAAPHPFPNPFHHLNAQTNRVAIISWYRVTEPTFSLRQTGKWQMVICNAENRQGKCQKGQHLPDSHDQLLRLDDERAGHLVALLRVPHHRRLQLARLDRTSRLRGTLSACA